MNTKPLPTILLVDDDQVDALALARSFRERNLHNTIVRARDGIEALAHLRGEGQPRLAAPYIVLLDLNMPRMGGVEFLEALRADRELCGTVVFALTTSVDEADRAAAYRHQVAGYIRKSTAGDEFADFVGMLERYWKVVELPGT